MQFGLKLGRIPVLPQFLSKQRRKTQASIGFATPSADRKIQGNIQVPKPADSKFQILAHFPSNFKNLNSKLPKSELAHLPPFQSLLMLFKYTVDSKFKALHSSRALVEEKNNGHCASNLLSLGLRLSISLLLFYGSRELPPLLLFI